MTNATKTLALLFAGSLVLALGTTWGGGSASSTAFEEQLFAVDTAQVQAIRIERVEGPSVRLERSDETWSVAPDDTSATFPASSQVVQRLLGSLPSLEISAVATRQTDKHPQYGVDSTGTRVTMMGAGGETLGQLIVGRTQIQRSSPGRQRRSPMRRQRQRQGTPITYVRTPDAPDVYSIDRPLNSIVERNVEGWRNKRIWAVAQSNIQQINFDYPADSSFTIQRAAPSDTAAGSSSWLSAGDTLSTNKVSSLLRTISSPEADGFVEGQSPDALGTAPYTVRLQLSDGASRTLRFHPSGGGTDYRVTADDYPYVARMRASRWDRTVLQGRGSFLRDK